MKQQYLVENIKCGGCINSINNALKKIPEIESIDVDLETGRITITGNPDHDKVVKKLNEMGYPELGENDLVKKAKSYVSCAIGKMTKE
jgi:copper chaperone